MHEESVRASPAVEQRALVSGRKRWSSDPRDRKRITNGKVKQLFSPSDGPSRQDNQSVKPFTRNPIEPCTVEVALRKT